MKNNIEFTDLSQLQTAALACTLCADKLPLGPKPIIQTHINAKILIAGQAPGSIAHASGIPFMDKSGERLRAWMGLSEAQFYNPENVAIVPMGFCYPGKAKSGDAPPLKECAQKWQKPFKVHLPNIRLKLLIGLHSQRWHLGAACKPSLTQTVMDWREYYFGVCSDGKQAFNIPLPHPSPRNNIWMAKNAWFVEGLLPELKSIVRDVLG